MFFYLRARKIQKTNRPKRHRSHILNVSSSGSFIVVFFRIISYGIIRRAKLTFNNLKIILKNFLNTILCRNSSLLIVISTFFCSKWVLSLSRSSFCFCSCAFWSRGFGNFPSCSVENHRARAPQGKCIISDRVDAKHVFGNASNARR